MNIIQYKDANNIYYITVIGEIESQYDEIYFLELIQEKRNYGMHITFLDANIFGSRIIERLYQLQQNESVKLYVQKPYLYSYFYNLGIQSNYISCKPLSENIKEKDYTIETEAAMLFLHKVKERYGYDYTQYQLESIIRRIKACMLKETIKSFELFQEGVLNSELVFEQMFLHFSINTTDFFRNPEVFKEIKVKIMPYLSSFPHIKIWCAGCSTGQEPYSLAILLNELGILEKTQIYATDINPYVIEEAKNGLYPLKCLESNISNYRKAGGSGSFMDYFKVKGEYIEIDEKLKKNILFFQHSLDGNGVLNEFQLILCRNVLIYFTPILQRKVLENFSNSLDCNGFLTLGKSEGILHNGGHEFLYEFNRPYKIYKKKESY